MATELTPDEKAFVFPYACGISKHCKVWEDSQYRSTCLMCHNTLDFARLVNPKCPMPTELVLENTYLIEGHREL